MRKSDCDDKIKGRLSKRKESIKVLKIPLTACSPYSKSISKSKSLSNIKSPTNVKSPVQMIFSNTKKIFQEPISLPTKQKLVLAHAQSDFRINTYTEEDIGNEFLNHIKNAKNIEAKFEICQKYFEEIIKNDNKYNKILWKIKATYESRLENAENILTKRLKIEINELQNMLQNEYKEKKLFLKKLEKLSKENFELSKTLEGTQDKYNALVNKIKEISQVDMSKLSKEEMNWKYLINENENLNQINKEMQLNIKKLTAKEKKLVNLLIGLKSEGYPVDKFYEKQLTKSKRSATPQSYSEDTENEALVSDRLKSVKIPECIPRLKLDDIHQDTFSSDSLCSEKFNR